MNQIKPEERPKVIGLLVAVATVFGFGGFNVLRMTGAIGGSATPNPDTASNGTPVTPQVDASAPPTVAPAARPGTLPIQQAQNVDARDQVVLPNLSNNPFRSIPQDAPGTGAVAQPPSEPLPKTGPQRQAGPREDLRMPIFRDPGPQKGPGSFASPTMAVAPAPVAPIPLQLVGVVSGDEAMAMIQVGTRMETVHVGERVSGYRVVRINIDDVTLRKGGLLRVLRVGDPASDIQEASTAEADPDETLPAPAPVRRVRPARVAARLPHLEPTAESLAASPLVRTERVSLPPPTATVRPEAMSSTIQTAPSSEAAGPATVPAAAPGPASTTDPINLPLAPGVVPATGNPTLPPATPPAAGGR